MATFWLTIALCIPWIIGSLFFFLTILAAMGKKVPKIFSGEKLTFGQSASTICYILGLIMGLLFNSQIWIIYIVALPLVFLFYLQPTPRISKIILYFFLISSILAAIVIAISK